jgi:2'-5' RNA ligase
MEKENFEPSQPIICDLVFNFPKKEHQLITNEKKNIALHYGKQARVDSIPHITLCSFLVLPERVEKLISNLKEKLADLEPIKVSLDGFGYFSSNLIYANLEPKISFTPFYNMLKTFRFHNYYREKNFKISQNPHATLARIDDNKLFNLVFKEYQSKTINSTFILDNLVIRKQYGNGEGKEYEHIKLEFKR